MDNELSPTISDRKQYASPELVCHGNVDEITQTGGIAFIDVPIGTPADGDVAGS